MPKKALVIGAGIHGSTAAIELGRAGYSVLVVDAQPDLFMGTSGASHNRIHLGHHYPRSRETILECRDGHAYFKENFGESLTYPEFYYVIHKERSRTSTAEYRAIMDEHNLPYQEEWPDEYFLDRSKIDSSFRVQEAYFDVIKLRELIKVKFAELGITTRFSFPIKEVSRDDNRITLTSASGETLETEADLIVNATYTNTNALQKAFGTTDHLTEYEYENTEVAVVASERELPALTVMDGPFITVMPYGGHPGQYVIYDVVNSVVSRTFGYDHVPETKRESNWAEMRKHGMEYYPFFKDLTYVRSLWANRPIPLRKEAQTNDSRATRIVRHDYPIPFYSILEGKLVSAPLAAVELLKQIKKETGE